MDEEEGANEAAVEGGAAAAAVNDDDDDIPFEVAVAVVLSFWPDGGPGTMGAAVAAVAVMGGCIPFPEAEVGAAACDAALLPLLLGC